MPREGHRVVGGIKKPARARALTSGGIEQYDADQGVQTRVAPWLSLPAWGVACSPYFSSSAVLVVPGVDRWRGPGRALIAWPLWDINLSPTLISGPNRRIRIESFNRTDLEPQPGDACRMAGQPVARPLHGDENAPTDHAAAAVFLEAPFFAGDAFSVTPNFTAAALLGGFTDVVIATGVCRCPRPIFLASSERASA